MEQSGVTATIITTTAGVIEWVDPPGARLLNTSARSCAGRYLLPFFDGDRLRILASLRLAAQGEIVEIEASIRPRDRKPVPVALRLAPNSDRQGAMTWICTVQDPVPVWFLLLGS
jgi:PAS domain-containing protein